MIETIINGMEVKIKKAIIIKILSEGTEIERVNVLKILKNIEELKKVKGFYDYCEYTSCRIAEGQKPVVYNYYLKKIKSAVENHGIPQRGHLDDHAKRLLADLESTRCEILKEDPRIIASAKVVRAHYHEGYHSGDYEKHLHCLHEIIGDVKKGRYKAPDKKPAN